MFHLIALLWNPEVYEKTLTACPCAIIEKAHRVYDNRKGKGIGIKREKLHLSQHGKRFRGYKEKLNRTVGFFSIQAF